MSILIRGMVMPQCCGECKFMVDRWCYASEDAYFVLYKRHPDCPLVEVPTPYKGEWIVNYDEDCPQDGIFKCSICGQIISVETPIPLNFCPNCGADMRGEI